MEDFLTRTRIAALLAFIVAVPAATASSYFSTGASTFSGKPCFSAGGAAYDFSDSAKATHVVRVDNTATNPSLRMQLVDDPATADFVLVDDGDAARACKSVATIESIRIDPEAAKPELVVALSRAPADYKIYVKSAHFSEQDAAALFAVIWQKAETTGSLRGVVKRN